MDHLFVHGTTQAPSAWARVAEHLGERGHRTLAVDLPVDQPDLVPADYARIAAAQADGVLDRPVVVAHSGGGLVASALAAAVDAPHVVWLAAVVPDFAGGRSLRQQIEADVAGRFGPEWSQWTGDEPAEAVDFLFHDCDLATLRWALTTLRPWRPVAAYEAPPGPAPSVPSTYVVPTADRTLRPRWMRAAARDRLGVDAVELGGDHCPHMSRAADVAELLDGLAGRLPVSRAS